MNYFRDVFRNFKNIFYNHRELLFNLINFQIFLRLFWFFILLWVAALFKRSFLEESDFSLNYEALDLLFSTEVIFFGILYVFLFFFFLLLEKIWLNLILFQNESNPKFLLKNIYTELLKNLRKIMYLFFLEFAIISFILAIFIYFSVFIYISVGLWIIFWVLESLLIGLFGYFFIKTYLFFIFVNFEVFYVEKNIFEAFSLSIRGINKKKTISHLGINYWIIIGWILLFDFIITSLVFLLWWFILLSVNILTIWIVSLIISLWILTIILSSFLLMSLLSIIEFQIFKKEIKLQEPRLTINPPDKLNINKTILFLALFIMSIITFIVSFYTLFDYDKVPTITAHRWASLSEIPNTLSAFEAAIEQWADIIELDVQQTLDWVIVVFHDKNLKNKTGYDQNLYQTNSTSLQNLTRTEVIDGEEKTESIPTLEEVLNLIQDTDIRLNIELKVYRSGQDYSRRIVRLIEKYSMQERVVITSLDINILEQFRLYNKTIPRGIIVTLLVGDIFNNDFEFISVNSQIINLPLVIRSKIYGKWLDIWIFNQSSDIDEMMSFSPDNIIVDDIEHAVERREYFENLSNRKKIITKIENIFMYFIWKIR